MVRRSRTTFHKKLNFKHISDPKQPRRPIIDMKIKDSSQRESIHCVIGFAFSVKKMMLHERSVWRRISWKQPGTRESPSNLLLLVSYESTKENNNSSRTFNNYGLENAICVEIIQETQRYRLILKLQYLQDENSNTDFGHVSEKLKYES
jgi:hypothetical protein